MSSAALAPSNADIRYHLAVALARSGQQARARKELEELLATGKSFAKIEEAKLLLKRL